MKPLIRTLFAAAAVMFTAQHATAAIVETWSVKTEGSWGKPASNSGVTRSGKTLSWGESTGYGKSKLTINNPGTLSVNTYTGTDLPSAQFITPTLSLTHDNKPVAGDSKTLTDATLSVSMQVKAGHPGASWITLPTFEYSIKFLETENSGACLITSSPTPCNDIFVLTSGLLDDSFQYAGYTYYVNAFPIDGGALNTLDDAACIAAGTDTGCLGFTTAENKSTTLKFGLTITTTPFIDIITPPVPDEPSPTPPVTPTPVSEPASLAVLGIALLGAGLARRRVNKVA